MASETLNSDPGQVSALALLLDGDVALALRALERLGGWRGFSTADQELLCGVVGEESARRIVAARRLSELTVCLEGTQVEVLESPEAAFGLVRPLMTRRVRERMVVVVLDVKNRPLSRHVVAEGTYEGCAVDPRDVFRPALVLQGSAVLVAHNHPSGDPQPSKLDLALTARLLAAGEILGLPLVDHLVIGGTSFVSMAAAGHLDALRRPRRQTRRR
jgi:DNA repair protein RadC